MNRFRPAKHAEDRAPSGCDPQQNANLFLHEPLVVDGICRPISLLFQLVTHLLEVDSRVAEELGRRRAFVPQESEQEMLAAG